MKPSAWHERSTCLHLDNVAQPKCCSSSLLLFGLDPLVKHRAMSRHSQMLPPPVSEGTDSWLPQDFSYATQGENNRLVYTCHIDKSVHLLPPKQAWDRLPEYAKSWGGWRIPYGWEPAVDASAGSEQKSVYFLDHVQMRCRRTLPAVELAPRDVKGGLTTRVVSLVRPGKSANQALKGTFGFSRDDPKSPDLVTTVISGGPADLGDDGLRVGDRIRKIQGIDFALTSGDKVIKTLSPSDIHRIISEARPVLVLTVESSTRREMTIRQSILPTTGKIIKVNFENGFSKKVAIGTGESAQDVVNRVATQGGFIRTELFQLRIESDLADTDGAQTFRPGRRRASFTSWTSRWIHPDQIMEDLPELAQAAPVCWLSLRFTPGTAKLAQLHNSDNLCYDYLFHQTVKWIERGVVTQAIDDESAVRLAALVAQRKWCKGVEPAPGSKRKVPNLAVLDKEIGLESLFTKEMRDWVKKDKQKLKKRMISFLKRHLASSDDDLKTLYLEVATKTKLVGRGQFLVIEKGSGLRLHLIVDPVDGVYKCGFDGSSTRLGSMDQIIAVQTEPQKSPDATNARSWLTLKIHSGQPNAPPSKWMFLGDSTTLADLAYVLNGYYGMLVNRRRSILETSSSLSRRASTNLANPAYAGIHKVLQVGWNYVVTAAAEQPRKSFFKEKFPMALSPYGQVSRQLVHIEEDVQWQNMPGASHGSYIEVTSLRPRRAAPAPPTPAVEGNTSLTSYDNPLEIGQHSVTAGYEAPKRPQSRLYEQVVFNNRNEPIVDVKSLSELTIDEQSARSTGSRRIEAPPPLPLEGNIPDSGEYIQIGDSESPGKDSLKGFGGANISPLPPRLKAPAGAGVAMRNAPKRNSLPHDCEWGSPTDSVLEGFDGFDGGFDMDSVSGFPSPSVPMDDEPSLEARSAKTSASSSFGFGEMSRDTSEGESAAPPIPPRRSSTFSDLSETGCQDGHDGATSREEELAENMEALNVQLMAVAKKIQQDDVVENVSRVERNALMTEMWNSAKMMVTSMWLLAQSAIDGEPFSERQSDAVDACSMLTELLQVTCQLSGSFGQRKEMLFVMKDLSIKFLMVIRAVVQSSNAVTVSQQDVLKVFKPFIQSASVAMRLLLVHERGEGERKPSILQ